jgi:hypothetical protein
VTAEHAADDRDDIAGETGGIGMQRIISVIEQHGLLVVFLNVLLAQSGLGNGLVTVCFQQLPRVVLDFDFLHSHGVMLLFFSVTEHTNRAQER